MFCKKIRAKPTISTCYTHTHTHTDTKVQRHTEMHAHTFTLAADLNWARQGLGGRTKQDRKYSSQMERWRGQGVV